MNQVGYIIRLQELMAKSRGIISKQRDEYFTAQVNGDEEGMFVAKNTIAIHARRLFRIQKKLNQ